MIPARTLNHLIKTKKQQAMMRKRNNIESTHPGPATAALESASRIMEEFEASEQLKKDAFYSHHHSKGTFSDRFDSSVESALFGFPRIGWQSGSDHRSKQHNAVKKQRILDQVREQLNLHSPTSRHSSSPYRQHHHGLVRCLYFASDLSETAGIVEDPISMDVDEDNYYDTIMRMD